MFERIAEAFSTQVIHGKLSFRRTFKIFNILPTSYAHKLLNSFSNITKNKSCAVYSGSKEFFMIIPRFLLPFHRSETFMRKNVFTKRGIFVSLTSFRWLDTCFLSSKYTISIFTAGNKQINSRLVVFYQVRHDRPEN